MGQPSPLLSSFKLSYYTLLNLMRRMGGGGHDMEFVIKRSFQQFQFESNLPKATPSPPSYLDLKLPPHLQLSMFVRHGAVCFVCAVVN